MARNHTQRPPSREEQLKHLQSYGVEVRQDGPRWHLEKGHCVGALTVGPDGLQIDGEMEYRIGNEVAVLLDGGYQKFWKTPTRKVPALAEQLRELHDFHEALCEALGAESLYNEAIGTVSSTYQYDRLRGRPRAQS